MKYYYHIYIYIYVPRRGLRQLREVLRGVGHVEDLGGGQMGSTLISITIIMIVSVL